LNLRIAAKICVGFAVIADTHGNLLEGVFNHGTEFLVYFFLLVVAMDVHPFVPEEILQVMQASNCFTKITIQLAIKSIISLAFLTSSYIAF